MLRLLRHAPTVVVLLLLALIGWQGHVRGWRWEKPKEETETEAPEVGANEVDPFETPEEHAVSPFDSTLAISHDPHRCDLGARVVKRFDGAESVRKAGILLASVRQRAMDDVLTATASVEFDPSRLARVAPRVAGMLYEMPKRVGDRVEKGEILAVVEAPEVGRAKSAFRLARVQLELKQQLRDTLQSGVTPPRTIAEADAAVREARLNLVAAHQALLSLGFHFELDEVMKLSDDRLLNYLERLGLEERATLPTRGVSENLLPVINPLPHAGWVLKRDAIAGEPVAAQQTLLLVGDNSEMMVVIHVPQEKRQRVRIGCPVRFKAAGEARHGESFDSKVDWIAPEIDEKTRTVRARAFVKNPDGELKANTFGSARITLSDTRLATVVPEEAIQWEGCSHIVFVCEQTDDPESPIEFRVRKVTLGIRHDGFVEVVPGLQEKFALDFFHLIGTDGFIRCERGLAPGERIAVTGSHVLRSELFRDRLGTPEE